ncbi:hypothetical protein [Corynebacterium striatum]|nr:hypothetical protein [Corynebacterium striatum]
MKLKSTFQKVFPVLVVAATIFATPTGSFALETTPTVSAASPADSTQDKNLVGNQALAIPASEVSESTDFDTAMATLSHYLVYRADGQRHFDTEKAKEENASHYLLVAGENLNRVADNNEVMIYSLETRDMPGYGNWCGPGHSGPGAPINTLDSLCQKHDKCYGSRGYFACSCDRELVQGIRKNRGKFNGVGENAMALAIATYFNSAPCNPLA